MYCPPQNGLLSGASQSWRCHLRLMLQNFIEGCLSKWTLRLAMQEKVLRHAEELFEEGDTNHDGKLSSLELQALLIKVKFV